jgi:hypothetical protein
MKGELEKRVSLEVLAQGVLYEGMLRGMTIPRALNQM